ncbi:hypothetical protein NHG29_03190 [Aerococcaceae bacterium NML160702]|nr:hypothetical protein [Aerococcaceae bacterium NML160702]
MKDSYENVIAKDAKVEFEYKDGSIYIKTVTLLAKIANPLTEDCDWRTRPILAMLPYSEVEIDGKTKRNYTRSIGDNDREFIKKYTILEIY